ncbi:hypothetical protein DL762_003694 [Monosporascus cannonballus]|uniref:Uncharacterized protein n=1 Tax=Monosporascus cannonballus TaxID=155416 RepID=A0ABY0HEC3_9PEZI|nr:hypothetical protein DL762_003694 [Monosporascus cannonballus]
MHLGAEPASSPQGIRDIRRDSSGTCRAVDDDTAPTVTTAQSTLSTPDQPSGSKSDTPQPTHESPTMAQSVVTSASSDTTNEPTSLAQKLAENSSQVSAPTGTEATSDTPSVTTALLPATPMSYAQPSHSAVRDLEVRDRSRDQEDGPSDRESALVPNNSESWGGSHDPDGNGEAGSAGKT